MGILSHSAKMENNTTTTQLPDDSKAIIKCAEEILEIYFEAFRELGK